MRSTSSPPNCPPRWATPRTDRPTYGGAVAVIADKLGTPLMPWQRQVVDAALEFDPATGLLAYRDVTVTVPRQAGKTTLLLAVMVWRALQWPGDRIVYTAHTGKDARLKFEDDHIPALNRSILAGMFRVRMTNGSEAIRWNNGSLHSVISPTETAGHGTQIDTAVVDEAWKFTDFSLDQGLSPAMITRSRPQMWIISTAGHDGSTYLKAKVEAGRDAVRDKCSDGLAYFEWSAEDGADPSDPATWWSCIPSLGHTVAESAIASEQRSKEPAEFERAYLNRWTRAAFASRIPGRSWEACRSDLSPEPDDVTFALDLAPDRGSASIAVSDGTTVELADHRPGTSWVIPRCIELWDTYAPRSFMVDQAGPAATIVPDLEAAGIRVEVTSAGQYAAACGRFYDAVVNREMRHGGSDDLTTAVAGAATRKLGDRWAWSRSTSSVEAKSTEAC